MKSILILLISLSAFFSLRAENIRTLGADCHAGPFATDSIAPDKAACDTLSTTDGQVYLVNIIEVNDKKMVEFYMCGDEQSGALRLPKDKVARIAFSPKKQKEWKKDKRGFYPLERMANQAMIFSIIAFASSIFLGVFAFPFAVVGIIKGERALRRLSKQPDHPAATAIKRKARVGVYVGFAYIILTALLVLLVVFILI